MTRPSIRRVEFDIDWPPGHVAAYVLDGDETILFDAGATPWSGEPAPPFEERAGYAPSEVDHVFLTHPHPDHVGHLRDLAAESETTVYAPFSALDRRRRDPAAVEARTMEALDASGLRGDERAEVVEYEQQMRSGLRECFPPDAVDEWVVDGQRVTVGGQAVDVVRTPGHHADHVCYLTDVDGERSAFSGDMLVESFRAVLLNDRFDYEYRNAVGAFLRSLDRLEDAGVERAYPGHGPVHDDVTAVLERDRESIARRVDGVREFLADGPATPATVANALRGSHDLSYLLPEFASALAHLENAGEAVTERADEGTAYRLV